jgi:hypothetical protein
VKVVVHWIVVLVIWCSWKGVQLGLLPLLPGLWFVRKGDVLVGVAVLRSRAARRFLMHSRLAELVGMLVNVKLLSTLGTDGRASMERVILLLSSVWIAGTLMGICTLRTCGMLGVAKGVATSSKRSGCACTWACVAFMIHWRSCAA